MISFRDSIKNDWKVFDNIFTGKVSHNNKVSAPNFTTNTFNTNTVDTTVEGCLYRDVALRNNQSIKQLHERDASVQNDIFYTADFVVEIPQKDGLLIDEGDQFTDMSTNQKFNIVAVDLVTLTTRIRVALRKFV